LHETKEEAEKFANG